LYKDGEATLSEHLGDLMHPQAYRHFVRAIERLRELFDFTPQLVAHDRHPQYLSTRYAQALGIPAVGVQHHHAHVVSVMAEWGQADPVIGVACDGIGYGTDGAAWGCELLHCRLGDFDRLGHLEYFPLVGGDAAAIETWRPAAALLRSAAPDQWRQSVSAMPAEALELLDRQASAGINAPPTSSLGRVFDAVSFLLGLCDRNRHEAEAALALEAAAQGVTAEPYPYDVKEHDGRVTMSLLPAIGEIARAAQAGESTGQIAGRFHETVARMLADAANTACEMASLDTVGLSGGCFANRILLSRLTDLLERRNLRVLYHRQVPCGDGGLALGQAVAAATRATADVEQDAT
jgi:hydrogenase maturation protein HypF